MIAWDIDEDKKAFEYAPGNYGLAPIGSILVYDKQWYTIVTYLTLAYSNHHPTIVKVVVRKENQDDIYNSFKNSTIIKEFTK